MDLTTRTRPTEAAESPDFIRDALAFSRLWKGFMTARVMIAVLLLGIQVLTMLGMVTTGADASATHLVTIECSLYFLATLAVRLFAKPRRPGRTFDIQWAITVGVDLVAFALLQFVQNTTINYAPLLAMPVLMAAVLGSTLIALGTAATVTILLLAEAWWVGLTFPMEASSRLFQAGLTGTGYFMVAFLTNQLASRLAREEERASRSAMNAQLQTQVNELVIEALADGILVIDSRGLVRSANPAAAQLIGGDIGPVPAGISLSLDPAWEPLQDVAFRTFLEGNCEGKDVVIAHSGQSPRRLRVRTRLTSSWSAGPENLCVMFLEDLREMEARLRTDKLVAMGRMSAAVAHEIRNPLAAISQANALLDEDLVDPGHKRLTLMVTQNTQRLARIVEEVLEIARVPHQVMTTPTTALPLDAAISGICRDWILQSGSIGRVTLIMKGGEFLISFDADHLRRVIVNLLDNALRYAQGLQDSIQVSTEISNRGQAGLRVWSDGAPLEKAVEEHLFEPFFSSESRSSGLGLYICRELCQRHAATIGYQRVARNCSRGNVVGNEFFVLFRHARATSADQEPLDSLLV